MNSIRHKRFSVLQLLICTAFVGLFLSNAVTALQLRTAQQELLRIRNESGLLDIDDPSMVHVIAAPALGKNQWRWRIFTPPDITFDCGLLVGDIPVGPLQDHKVLSRFSLESTEDGVIVTLDATQDMNGNYVLALSCSDITLYAKTETPPQTWLEGPGSVQTAATAGQESYEIGEPIILRLVRLLPAGLSQSGEQQANGQSSPAGSDRGHAVWLIPVPR